ncbi:ABC transporter substrate-binding protein [Polaromonas sp. A23]|uniref:ABC transporter substrate-binding protein n=1 Tax=Polaromonas sp. A23 TaxID=1944133 RepID=UPI00098538DA|nr:ABC transporter substrate-binding protein [Polaromonas sp. A23]OOG39095.1 ABC transporter substrate-binding protein [Polaromonas sp. A23]
MALNFSRFTTTMAALAILALPISSHAIELVFGQVASQTNPASASNAKGLATGIQAYFDRVNAGNTLQGNKLKLVTLDDSLQGPKMVELTQQLIGDPAVIGLLGFLNSAGLAEIAKQDLPSKNGIALIAPLQGDKNVISAANVFPLRSGYADEVGSLLKEAKTWGKDSLAIVNMSIAFGPPLAQLTTQLSGPLGVKIATQQVLDAAPDKLDASVRAAVAAIAEKRPKGIILLAAGKPAFEFVKAVRDVPGGAVQIYGLSVLQHDGLVNATGKDKARGIVLSQAVPFPFVPSKAVITEYQADMKKYAAGEALSFASLEGYMGAKIAVEAVRRAGKTPTRAAVLQALSNLGEYNLGGVYVNYTANQRTGWGGVDLSIINSSGSLQK